MENNLQKVYVLTDEEYNILLAGSGVKECYMLQSGEFEMHNDKICNAMMHLYSTGIIDSDGVSFSIQGELKGVIDAIKNAKYAMLIRVKDEDERAMCCYHTNDGFIVNELSSREDRSYLVYRCDWENLFDVILSSALYDKSSIGVLDEDKLYENVCDLQKNISVESFHRYVNLQMVIDYVELSSGKIKKRMLILNEENEKKLVNLSEETSEEKNSLFTEELLEEVLNDNGRYLLSGC